MKAEDFLRPHLLKLKAYTPIEPFEILAHKLGREPKDIVSGRWCTGTRSFVVQKFAAPDASSLHSELLWHHPAASAAVHHLCGCH